ncbi:Two-component sensor histidine kinase, contains HisKA and HATPase domains [Raineyella antarctica]|uniref:histidine kinase n=1 Tax=Raineyella antarctica TaxID=1577474 RepID=A0A1G6GUQ7_9ACTN|nr:sensor histidine kinase [Raineyella antarctica]SDB85747.1 Two-component sensor histidine kinase, contains HisKA and HATPase domains [Raineyella antarctica]
MPQMSTLLATHTDYDEEVVEWLRLLVNEWHLLADLSFSDLILWVPDRDPNQMWAVAQIRPTTGPTALLDDVVGDSVRYDPDSLALQAFWAGEPCETSDNKLATGIPVDMHAIPLRHGGRIIAVLEQHTNQMGVRANGALEDAYIAIAKVLRDMLIRGEFPLPGARSHPTRSPRVGDGLLWLGPGGEFRYATPNAVSAYRRAGFLGDIVAATPMSFSKEFGGEEEVLRLMTDLQVSEREVVVANVALRFRFIPLHDADGASAGACVVLRDITQIHRLDQQLITKDATIREIHHRVKNNLQTVSALLRMQARRVQSPEAKQALAEAMSRVASIAAVHEVLAYSFAEVVEFDDVADKILAMVGDVATPGRPAVVVREGTFGKVSPVVATNLSLVVTELCQNAVEHGLHGSPGTVRVVPLREDGRLEVRVLDEGVGLPEGFDPNRTTSLGLGIVTTLVADMHGSFELTARPEGGVVAVVRVPAPERE